MKEIKISRKTPDGSVSYKTRIPQNVDERELALQEDCLRVIKAGIEEYGNTQADAVAKMVLSATAMVHSSLERILRDHGKKQVAK